MVFYNRCPACSFLFTASFDGWTPADFSEFVYNEFYGNIDSGAKDRVHNNAAMLAALFQQGKSQMSVLDFGGGDGTLAQRLREHGFASADSYDPFFGDGKGQPERTYSLVTCYEVMEHVSNPGETVQALAKLAGTTGIVVFSTLVQPVDIQDRGLFWWYVSPRAGHISIYSKDALTQVWAQYGFRVASFDDNLHVAFTQVPDFARHFLNV